MRYLAPSRRAWFPRSPSSRYFPIWLGVGPESKIAVSSPVAFVVLVQTLLAMHAIAPELGRSLKMSGRQLFRLRLPAAVPAIMVGFKLGAAHALLTIVVGEMSISSEGLARS